MSEESKWIILQFSLRPCCGI